MDKLHYFNIKIEGQKFFFRHLLPSDKDFIQHGFRNLSPKSKYLRFFTHQNELSESQLKFFSEPDGRDHVAWGVMDVTDYKANPAGTARFVRVKEEPEFAEVAITIVDAYHRKGLSRIMLAILNIVGARQGIKTFRYHILPENIGLLKSLGTMGKQQHYDDKSIILLDSVVLPDHKSIILNEDTRSFYETMKMVEQLMIER